MPTYDYRCAKCGDDLEVYQTFSEAPLTRHKGCGGKLAKVLSPAGIVLKGSGFYKTDNRSSSGSKRSSDTNGTDRGGRDGNGKDSSGSSSGDSSKSTETKTESKSDSGGSGSGDGKSSGSGSSGSGSSSDSKKPAAKTA